MDLKPKYVAAMICPTCGIDDAVALATEHHEFVVWCERGHVSIIDQNTIGVLVYTFCE